MNVLRFTSLACVKPSSGPGNDDLYFKITVDDSQDTLKIPNDPDLTDSWDIDEGTKIAFQPSSQLQDGTTIPGTRLAFPFDSNSCCVLFVIASWSALALASAWAICSIAFFHSSTEI